MGSDNQDPGLISQKEKEGGIEMSLAPGRSFRTELQYALQSANLPLGPEPIIGRMFRFGCEHGSHHHILVGTITAIEVSDEGGLQLHVSSPKMWGEKIKGISHTSRGWVLVLDIPHEKLLANRMEGEELDTYIYEQTVFPGEFELL
ncbi:MAG: hypothetical protein KW788_01560 [Candidatus Doudnabacteria bacterium]|nr:hypothetical protein [Candidatus Doudnabacteria bacterium]